MALRRRKIPLPESTFRVGFAVLVLSLVFAAPALAQSHPSQSAAAPRPVSTPSFSVNTDEVSLDLVVRTKGGKPVLDLKPGDIEITDDGKPVKLSDLHLVKGVESEHLVTLLFDQLNPGPAKAARELAAKILKVIPDQGYSYAILEMNGRLRLLQSWTSSRDQVDQAVATATTPTLKVPTDLSPAEKELLGAAQDDSLSTDFADRTRAKLLLTGLEETQRLLEDNHTYSYPSLSALTALANAQRQITGRKVIIWFAQGLSADNHARDAVKALVGQANRAGVTIIAVDTDPYNQAAGDRMMAGNAIGMQNPGAYMAGAMKAGANAVYGDGISSGGHITGSSPTQNPMSSGSTYGQHVTPAMAESMANNMTNLEFDSLEDTKSPLGRLALDTGGVYMQAGTNLKRPLRLLEEDLTTYYQASYSPGIKDYNGAFRPIVVHPLRKNILVTSRAGYFAVPPDTSSGIRPFEVPLLNLLAVPQLPTDLGFRTAILHLGRLPDGNTAVLTVQLPVAELEVHEDANTHLSQVHATIVSQIKNAKGAVVQRFSEDVPLHETPDMLRSDPNQVITMQRHFTADPGQYTLETAVMDRQGSKAGAQRTTFMITPPAQGPALSDIALVRSVEPIHAETATFEPLRYETGRIVPDLSGELPENAKALSLFFLVHPLRGSTAQPDLTMQIFRNRELIGKMPLELRRVSGTGGAIPYLGNIQSRAFPPGNYEIKAVLTQDGQTAISSASFSVEGTIAATNAPMSSFTASSGAAETAAERAADQHLTATAALANSRFVIASPSNPVPQPTALQVQDVIDSARQRALAWSETLPNFFCVEITDHSVDPDGRGDWRHKDTMVQLMRYADHQESRTTLELNGQKSHVQPAELDFAHSVGEFGGMFQVVFDPVAKAKFTWKESDVLDGQPVQVFAFQVAQEHSNFDLTGENNRQNAVGFHGLLYLDSATRSVRRITLSADDIPEKLQVRATTISVDYSWVSINNHDYLMPARGAISLREGKHQAVLNEFEFRDYRRFGSQIRILSAAESKTLSKN
ncbi:MAG TPA: VWA domain-containing protein [Acidobacteriaceae bacterium]|jgi:VWFA-related protein|nr:VWA domain-containing protein [Acidobacteriaceae bacterium]